MSSVFADILQLKPTRRTSFPSDWRAYVTVFASVLINLSLGVLYTFGNALPYLASYLASIHGNTKEKYDHYLDQCSWIFVCQALG